MASPRLPLPLTTSVTTTVHQQRQYTVAITRGVPHSFPYALTSNPDYQSPSAVSYEVARSQHAEYVSTLRSILPTLRIPPNESYPDCVFVEDTAIVIQNSAVVTQMSGAPSRVGEVDEVKSVLIQFGLNVTDMRQQQEQQHRGAMCDGGDVLHPVGFRNNHTRDPKKGNRRTTTCRGGRHVFVGLSDRTNEAGVAVLKSAFEKNENLEVVPVPMDIIHGDALHLKSIVTHVDENTLLVPAGQLGEELVKVMRARELGYAVVRLPDVGACNVVSANGVILAPPTECEETKRIFEKETSRRKLIVRYVDSSEFGKRDGALTCKCILLDV